MSGTVDQLVVLTDRHACEAVGRSLTETVGEAVDGGARAVLMREKDMSLPDRRWLLDAVCCLLEPFGGRVGIASDANLAISAGVDWVHLAQADRLPARLRGVDAPELLVGRSCHSVAEAVVAREQGCDYITASPVAITRSKPGYGPPLDIAGLRAICAAAGVMPVLALGGVTPNDCTNLFAAGAHGVAVMGGIMSATDPAVMTAAYIRAIESAS